jgi:hypothetical protein
MKIIVMSNQNVRKTVVGWSVNYYIFIFGKIPINILIIIHTLCINDVTSLDLVMFTTLVSFLNFEIGYDCISHFKLPLLYLPPPEY